jgi:hypothetical protein
MRRPYAFAISLLLGGGIAAGAAASLRTAHLGAAPATPATLPDRTVAHRRAKLATWSASLQKARKAKPPALPRVPRYAPVQIPTMPAVQSSTARAQIVTVQRLARRPAPTTGDLVRVEHTAPPPPPETPSVVGTTTGEPADDQVVYVQPPPIIQYQQAPAPPATTTGGQATGEHEDEGGHEGDDDHQAGTTDRGESSSAGGDD